MNFAKALKIIRSVKNLEQQQLASALEVDSSYISLIESGKRSPSDNLINDISKKLGIPKNLLILLASDEKDLNNIRPSEASEIGKQLLQLLLQQNSYAEG